MLTLYYIFFGILIISLIIIFIYSIIQYDLYKTKAQWYLRSIGEDCNCPDMEPREPANWNKKLKNTSLLITTVPGLYMLDKNKKLGKKIIFYANLSAFSLILLIISVMTALITYSIF